jgi:uncharacterized protein YggE
MKFLIIPILAVFMLAGTSRAEMYQAEHKRLISVSGTGEIHASPDLGVIHVGATTEAPRASRCYSDNNEIMGAVLKAITRLGVKKDDIKTTRFSFNPRYEYPGGGVRKFVGYQMTHIYTVKIRDLDIFGDVLDAASEAGANEISNISFTIDDPSGYQSEARELAVKDAEAKANTIAEAAGVEIVRVYRITEGPVSMPQPVMDFREMKAAAPSAPVEAGSQDVRVTVTVHYEIE